MPANRTPGRRPPGPAAGSLAVPAVACVLAVLVILPPSPHLPAVVGSSAASPGAGAAPHAGRLAEIYVITFIETGLPSGAQWWVDLAGINTSAGSSSAIRFSLGNGSYPYVVGASIAAQPIPGAGRISVAGADVNESVIFSIPPTNFRVTFHESGLPANLLWTVDLAGIVRTVVAGQDITFYLGNGSYPFAISTPANYTPDPSSGRTSVAGQPIVQAITFRPSNVPSSPASSTGENVAWFAAVAIGIIAVLAAVGFLTARQAPRARERREHEGTVDGRDDPRRRRRRRRLRPPPPPVHD